MIFDNSGRHMDLINGWRSDMAGKGNVKAGTGPSGHVHAESMRLYAEDATVTDKPWLLWQHKAQINSDWVDCSVHPGRDYRRKPKIRALNGVEFQEPIRAGLRTGQKYFLCDPTEINGPVQYTWTGDANDVAWLRRGLVHLTAEAAKIHMMAFLTVMEV